MFSDIVESFTQIFLIMFTRFIASALIMLGGLSLQLVAASADAQSEVVEVEVLSRFYDVNDPEAYPHLIEFMRNHPRIDVQTWSGLTLPGGGYRAPLMMSIAGQTAPDIMESWFHIIRTDIDQGFLYPLNEWIGDDLDGDGRISDEEAKWEQWKEVPQLLRDVATVDGKVYGIPQTQRYLLGILYRRDLVVSAGLDPNDPPETWEEFLDFCMRLTYPGRPLKTRQLNVGQRAFVIPPMGFTWLPWLEAAGGDAISEIRVSPTTGETHVFPPGSTSFVTPEGEDLGRQKSNFETNFSSPAGIAAAEFYHRLMWTPWIVDPVTEDPIELSDRERDAGFVEYKGRTIEFEPEDVVEGVAYGFSGRREGDSSWRLIGREQAAMTSWFVQDLVGIGNSTGINPDNIGWFPIPAANEKLARVVQSQRHYASLSAVVALRRARSRICATA